MRKRGAGEGGEGGSSRRKEREMGGINELELIIILKLHLNGLTAIVIVIVSRYRDHHH